MRGLFCRQMQSLLPVQQFLQLVERAMQVLVGAALLVDLADGVHHRGVVLVAELAADFRQAGFGHLLGQVHGDLPRHHDVARVVLLLQVAHLHAELLGHGALNRLDRDLAHLHVDELLEALLRRRQRDLHAIQLAPGDQPHQRAFEFAHVGAHVRGDEQRHIGRQLHLLALRLLLQDGDLGFEIGRLNVGDQSPLKARAQPVFNLGQFLGRTVRSDHDLLHALVQRVEGVEELFLRALLLRDELNVVDQQHVDGAEAIAEAGHAIVAQRGDHLVGELLRRDVADACRGLAALHLVADGVHQVRLAHSHAAIEEERIVGARGPLGDGQRGGARKLVAVADDEVVEGVARIQLRGGRPVEARLLRRARGAGGGAVGACAGTGPKPPSLRCGGIDGSSSAVTKHTSSNSSDCRSIAS